MLDQFDPLLDPTFAPGDRDRLIARLRDHRPGARE